MRALRLHKPRDLRMHDEPTPRPDPGEVLMQVKSVGVCASDLHWYRDGRIGTTMLDRPLVLGHEASAVVVELGEGVTELSAGDHVAIEPAKPCLQCDYCKAGYFNLCPGIPFFGTPPTDGAFRDYLAWPAQLAFKVPDSLGFDEIAMIEPLTIGAYAVELARPEPGRTAAIIGAGAIGLSVLQALRIEGMERIIVSEPVEARRKAAMSLGAQMALNPNAADIEGAVMEATDGRGVDLVFECAGEHGTCRDASRIAAILGKIVVVGIPDGDDYIFDASASRRKQLSIVFARRSNKMTEKIIRWVVEGKVDAACLATHAFTLERLEEAMELGVSKDDGVVRAVIHVNT